MAPDLPLLPTTVCGSHALPSWLHLVREAEAADRLGPTDRQEAYDDAVRVAIRDQIEAGVDVISDGEMRRLTFIRGFYARLAGSSWSTPTARWPRSSCGANSPPTSRSRSGWST